MKIDFGCADRKCDGYIGIDVRPYPNLDILYDGGIIPLPDNSVDAIYSHMCLEHVDDFDLTIRELWRISKSGTIWELILPHASNIRHRGVTDHKRLFCLHSFDNYGTATIQNGWSNAFRKEVDLELVSVGLRWWEKDQIVRKVLWKRILVSTLDNVITWVANLHPFFCERVWCNFVGGFDEVTLVLKVRKS